MRAISVALVASLIVVLGALVLILSYFQAYREEHGPKWNAEAAERRTDDQLDAITTAFLREMSGRSPRFQQPEILAICISQRDHVLPETVFLRLMERLKKTVPKIQAESYCESLHRRKGFFIYWLDSFEQKSDKDASVGVGFRDSIDGIYQEGEVVNMKKSKGKWEVTIIGPVWIS